MRPKKRRTDANQSVVAHALSQSGHHVTDLSGCGRGIPDLLCTRNGQCFLVEIKNPKGRNRFTSAQLEYYAAVKAPVFVVRGINDVESLIKGELEPINCGKSPVKPRKKAINGRKDEKKASTLDS